MTGRWKGMLLFLFLMLCFSAPVAGADPALEGFWMFNETSGDLLDWSGNGIDGTVHGDPDRGVAGVNNSTAYRFDGEDDWVELPDDEATEVDQGLTVEMWVRPASTEPSGSEHMFQRGTSAAYGLYTAYTGRMYFSVDTSHSGGEWHAASFDMDDARWYHVMGTYNGSVIRLYRDGELVDTSAQQYDVDEGYDRAGIGGHPEERDYFEGTIDEFRIYSRTLNETEVQWHYEDPPGWDPKPADTDGTDDTEGDGSEDNETSDGSTTDNETTSDNTTTNETSDGTSDDGSLFTGGNGTDGDDGAVADNETVDDGSTTDNETDGDTGKGSNDTYVNSTGSTAVSGENGSVSMRIEPRRVDATVERGKRGGFAVRVTNTGTEQLSLSLDVQDLSFIRAERSSISVAPEEAVTTSFSVVPAREHRGGYEGFVQVSGNGIRQLIPVEVTVTPLQADDRGRDDTGGEDVRLAVGLDTNFESVRSNETGILGGVASVRTYTRQEGVTLTSRIRDGDGTVVHERVRENVSIALYDEYLFDAGEQLAPGEYRWTVTVEKGGTVAEASSTFTVEAVEGTGGSDGTAMVVVVVLLLVVGTGIIYRVKILKWVQERAPVL